MMRLLKKWNCAHYECPFDTLTTWQVFISRTKSTEQTVQPQTDVCLTIIH